MLLRLRSQVALLQRQRLLRLQVTLTNFSYFFYFKTYGHLFSGASVTSVSSANIHFSI